MPTFKMPTGKPASNPLEKVEYRGEKEMPEGRKFRNRSNKVLYANMRNSSAKTEESEHLAVKEGFDKRGTS